MIDHVFPSSPFATIVDFEIGKTLIGTEIDMLNADWVVIYLLVNPVDGLHPHNKQSLFSKRRRMFYFFTSKKVNVVVFRSVHVRVYLDCLFRRLRNLLYGQSLQQQM